MPGMCGIIWEKGEKVGGDDERVWKFDPIG